MRRGEVWWASLPEPSGSGPGYRRPYLIVSANSFNESRINTIIGAVITSNLRLADAPALSAGDTVEIGGQLHEVQGTPTRDSDRLVWLAEARAL